MAGGNPVNQIHLNLLGHDPGPTMADSSHKGISAVGEWEQLAPTNMATRTNMLKQTNKFKNHFGM